MFWEEISWKNHEGIDRKTPVVFNVGAVEQHGPALPAGTDSYIGWALCNELNLRMPEKVIILPQIKIAYSQHHMDFPGTLTVSHESLISYMGDIIESVISQGFRNLLILNSHGGNQGAMQVLMEKSGNKYPHVNIISTTWWKLCSRELLDLRESGFMGNGHAAEFEFSLMQYLHNDLIDYRNMSAGKIADTGFSWAENDLISGPKAALFRTFREMTSDGTYGLTKDSGREKGEMIFNIIINILTELIEDIYALGERQRTI